MFGPRQTGKTYIIKNIIKPHLYIDLFKHSEFIRFSRDPSLLGKEVATLGEGKNPGEIRLVAIDEIQRCPELLNEVQTVMEEVPAVRFALTGSSARKLKRGGANLLAGRAITMRLHPLTHQEWEGFDLNHALHFGSLPPVVLEPSPAGKRRLLKSYVETYLKEEIQQEALTRNVPAFARFLELAAFEHGNLVNCNKVAQEIGVHAATVKEYFQILEDTLVGFLLPPFTRSARRRLATHPRFYFFDNGVVAALKNELSRELIPASPPFGQAFEQWAILETRRILDYREREFRLSFFRTNAGAEVDLIIEVEGKTWAVEIKASSAPRHADLEGFRSFLTDHRVDRAVCVCLTPRPYREGPIDFLPWNVFFAELSAIGTGP